MSNAHWISDAVTVAAMLALSALLSAMLSVLGVVFE